MIVSRTLGQSDLGDPPAMESLPHVGRAVHNYLKNYFQVNFSCAGDLPRAASADGRPVMYVPLAPKRRSAAPRPITGCLGPSTVVTVKEMVR